MSAQVGLLSAIGPVLALALYGPYPESYAMPLLIGSAGSLCGFLAGVVLFKHPLQEELLSVWTRIRR